MNPSLFTQLPCASRSMGLALVVSLSLPAAHASTPTCRKADLLTPDYQKRTEMDRCEGIRREKPIAADGLQLTSYTIGQASPQMVPMMMELLRFGMQAFKAAKPIEGQIDSTLQQLQQAAAQQPPDGEQQGKQAELQQMGQMEAS